MYFPTGYLRYFHIAAVVSDVAMNVHVQMFAWAHVSTSVGHILRRGLAVSQAEN